MNIERLNTLTNYEVTVNAGDAKVNKAQLTINVGNAETTYGTKFDESQYDYGFAENAGLVNGDNASVLGNISYTNSAAKDGTNGVWTDNAGTYEDAVNIEGLNTLTNYEVTVNKGDAEVKKAHITITVDNQNMTAGGSQPQYTGNISGIANGDSANSLLGDYQYGLQDSSVTAVAGDYAIGIVIDGKYYALDSSLNSAGVSENYTYEINPGTLTVTAKPVDPVDPVDPIDPQPPVNPYPIDPNDPTDPSNPDVWQSEDKYPWYQWDKQRNERERKAEVHFVDGGMELN